ncbi:hypothetical protein BB558_005067 [Smittium angustum]|uniref:1-phosphatidylinositol 4-kinase n=1 Tax=Smittium angustum TaxID=133377 RepID=A0A2U1J1J9_SMIAN|nr:hypothetical protein BB558_005067 [Smittium angustum]
MQSFKSLHRQITSELADVLALTSGIQVQKNSVVAVDATISSMLQVVDDLLTFINSLKVDSDHKKKKTLMSLRQQNILIMIAKTARNSTSIDQKNYLVNKVIPIYKNLRYFELEKDQMLNARVPMTYEFMKVLTQEILLLSTTPNSTGELAKTVVWNKLAELGNDIEKSSANEVWAELVPAMIGIMEAIETKMTWCTQYDVEAATKIAKTFFKAENVQIMNTKLAKVLKQQARTRGKAALRVYAQSGWKPSGNILLVRHLHVLQIILEIRLISVLVEMGLFQKDHLQGKSTIELRQIINNFKLNLISQIHPKEIENGSEKINLDTLISISLKTFLGMRSIIVDSIKENQDINSSAKESAELIMRRSLKVATLACFINGKLDNELLRCIFGHINSKHSNIAISVTESCFKQLLVISKFFSDLRPSITRASIDFIISHNIDSTADLEFPFSEKPQRKLIYLVSRTLAKSVYQKNGDIAQVGSAMHEMINRLLAEKIKSEKEIMWLRRKIAMTIVNVAIITKDKDVCALAVSILLGPAFRDKEEVSEILIDGFGKIAIYGSAQTRIGLVTALLNFFSFGFKTPSNRIMLAVSESLSRLIRSNNDIVAHEAIVAVVIRSFFTVSNKFLENRSETQGPYLYYAPLLVAAAEKGAKFRPTSEVVSLWRQFWFYMIVNGLITGNEKTEFEINTLLSLSKNAPLLVHSSTVSYLETEIEYSLPSKPVAEVTSISNKLRTKLQTLLPAQSSSIKYMGMAQLVFLLAIYVIETRKAQKGNICSILGYFASPAIQSSKLLSPLSGIFKHAVLIYVRESKLSGNLETLGDEIIPVVGTSDQSFEIKLQNMSTNPNTQLQQLMVLACHYSSTVSTNSCYAIEEILLDNSSALLEKTTIHTLLELLQILWLSCKAELDDRFAPVYIFTSQKLNFGMQFPDSMSYRRELFSKISKYAQRWLERTGNANPVELQALLYNYLILNDDNLDKVFRFEPHIGRSLALEVGKKLNPVTGSGIGGLSDVAFDYETQKLDSSLAGIYDNASAFLYNYGEQCFISGRSFDSNSLYCIKSEMYEIYKNVRNGSNFEISLSELSKVSSLLAIMGSALVNQPNLDMELVRLLVWVPVTIFQKAVLQQAIYVWTRIVVERPDAELAIVVELSIVWHWIIQNSHGVFTQNFEPKNPFDVRMSYVPSDKTARSRVYEAISKELQPHRLLITFLLHRLDAAWNKPGSSHVIVDTVIRILQLTFDNIDKMSNNALARYERFQLVLMALKVLQWPFPDWIAEARFREKIFDLAFSWFTEIPKWSFSGNKYQLTSEVKILIDTHFTLQKYKLDLSELNTQFDSKTSFQQNSNKASTSPANIGHYSSSVPVYGLNHNNSLQSRPRSRVGMHERNASTTTMDSLFLPSQFSRHLENRFNRSRALLLLLLESEIRRLIVWANPVDDSMLLIPQAGKFRPEPPMSEDGWKNLVRDAWVANPRLALYLPKRFPNPGVEKELQILIRAFPGELVMEGESVSYLIEKIGTGKQVSGSSELGSSRPPNSVDRKYLNSTKSNYEFSNSNNKSDVDYLHSGTTDRGSKVANNDGGQKSQRLRREASRVAELMNENNTSQSKISFRELKFLLYSSAVSPVTAISILSSNQVEEPLIQQYAMRALEHFPVDVVFYNIPQLVQAIRHDKMGYTEKAIIEASKISQLFAHQIIWNIKANSYKDEDSKVPDTEIKPTLDRIVAKILSDFSVEDMQFYEKEFSFFNKVTAISGSLKPYIKKSKAEKKRKIDEEMRKIDVQKGVYLPSNSNGKVVGIDYTSGRPLQSHAKAPFMATFYIKPDKIVDDDLQELVGGGKLSLVSNSDPGQKQSPIPNIETTSYSGQESVGVVNNAAETLARIAAEKKENEIFALSTVTGSRVRRTSTLAEMVPGTLFGISSNIGGKSKSPETAYTGDSGLRFGGEFNDLGTQDSIIVSSDSRKTSKDLSISEKKKDGNEENSEIHDKGIVKFSAIFKVGDDCRQDTLALQLIGIFKNIFASCGLDLYLFPYKVVSTEPGCGVIEVIPNSISRDQIGREKVNSLYDYFVTKYGGADSIQFQQARSNFVQSCAAYSVLSYLLLFKDRHNGNIMLDEDGHLIHIDFGFILGIAPGGITFESAPFKLTTEYIQVMGGSATSQSFKLYRDLCIKGYLACRPYADQIIQTASIMADSGLPCFAKADTISKMRYRFQLELSERSAADFMLDRINESYENRRTVLYDSFQKATNGIPY